MCVLFFPLIALNEMYRLNVIHLKSHCQLCSFTHGWRLWKFWFEQTSERDFCTSCSGWWMLNWWNASKTWAVVTWPPHTCTGGTHFLWNSHHAAPYILHSWNIEDKWSAATDWSFHIMEEWCVTCCPDSSVFVACVWCSKSFLACVTSDIWASRLFPAGRWAVN